MENMKTVELRYFENGEEKTDKLKISFISNRVIREYNEIMKDVSFVSETWGKLQDLNNDVAKLRIDKPENYKLQIAEKKTKADDLVKEISKYTESDFFDRRMALIQRILSDNKYSGKYSNRFFDEQVNPGEFTRFLSDCVFKDFDVLDKKKD